MRLNSLEEVATFAAQNNFSIFELPLGTDFAAILPASVHIKPDDEKNTIDITKIRELSNIAQAKQSHDFYIIVENAETMNANAANAFLKALEEPNDKLHFVFLSNNTSQILPTIKSRASNYCLKNDTKISDAPNYDAETIALAKQYLSATKANLPDLADKITKLNKESSRQGALKILECAIELAYKTYFLTGNTQFLQKLEKLLTISDNIAANGHVKLQLVAGML
ncbi:hypothetical protein IKQ65_02825 [Candidatus Saccharibacteria bacterium]|nr:hypothetical protein [Candidatus Saccharibacteria bacterium]